MCTLWIAVFTEYTVYALHIWSDIDVVFGSEAHRWVRFSNSRGAAQPNLAVARGCGWLGFGRTQRAAEAGVDFLFALNAGVYRNQGSGSLAAFLPYGNANVQTEALLREHILPRRGSLPVVAGVLANDPTCPLERG